MSAPFPFTRLRDAGARRLAFGSAQRRMGNIALGKLPCSEDSAP
jgi:hypothetical protein